jgi:hypothetical protein
MDSNITASQEQGMLLNVLDDSYYTDFDMVDFDMVDFGNTDDLINS